MAAQAPDKVWSSRPTRSFAAGSYGGCGVQPGFVQAADNRMYEELRAAVLAEERQRRVSLGLPPDPPKKVARFKNWLLKREEQPSNVGGVSASSEDIKKS